MRKAIIVERDDGMTTGIEVTTIVMAKAGVLCGLRGVDDACGYRATFGTILCENTALAQFGDRLPVALPASIRR